MDQLTSSQLADWEVFDRFEPFGAEEERWRFGMVCTTIMRAVTAIAWNKKKRGPPPKWSPKDFFPSPLDEEEQPQTVEEMKEKLKAIAQMAGEKDGR